MDVRFFASPATFRKWLAQHHGTARELWVGFYKKRSGRASISYKEALEEALCVGWIDGVRKSIDDSRYMIRFSPRKPHSVWSAVNLRLAAELKRQGRLRPAGLEAFEGRDPKKSQRYSYENRPAALAPEYESLFKRQRPAWDFFQSQPPSYRRLAIWYVMSAVKEETRLRRLDALIALSSKERRLDFMAPRPTNS